jgi:excisionase family DNA binding protein
MSLLSSRALATELDTCEETIRRLWRRGSIPAYRVGRHLKFDLGEVRSALRDQDETTASTGAVEPNFDALDAA